MQLASPNRGTAASSKSIVHSPFGLKFGRKTHSKAIFAIKVSMVLARTPVPWIRSLAFM
jgi:hypothetical protein